MRIRQALNLLKRAGFVAASGAMIFAAGGCDVTDLLGQLVDLVIPA